MKHSPEIFGRGVCGKCVCARMHFPHRKASQSLTSFIAFTNKGNNDRWLFT